MSACCGVVELRQYELVPGGREVLIDLFEREFVESQEEVGMHLVGTFTDLDDPDRFVWIRGFEHHDARNRALSDFYFGPVWAAYRDQANATMRDSDNVLLLRATTAGPAFPVPADGRAPDAPVTSMYAVAVYAVPATGDESDIVGFFQTRVLPAAAAEGADTVALLRTDPADNGFRRLPVREGEHVLVWIQRFADANGYLRHLDRLAGSQTWQNDVVPGLVASVGAPVQQLRLAPTRRSRLR
jgi:hypothetical protein